MRGVLPSFTRQEIGKAIASLLKLRLGVKKVEEVFGTNAALLDESPKT